MQFYELEQNPRGRADTCFAAEEGRILGDADRCSECGDFISSLRWLPPYRVILHLYGKEFGDLVFGSAEDFLVSQNFREVYYKCELTGLAGFDLVEVIKVKDRTRRKVRSKPPLYFRVCPKRAAMLDQHASEFQWDRPPTCPMCKSGIVRSWKRLLLEPSTWTGEDAFRPFGLGGRIMVTQRFKETCEQHAITNAVFKRAEEAGHDYYSRHQ